MHSQPPPEAPEGSIRRAKADTPARRRTTSRRTTAARGTDYRELSPAWPPRPLLARIRVERDQHPREPRGLAFTSSPEHEGHGSPRMSSFLREELRATGTGKALSTLFL